MNPLAFNHAIALNVNPSGYPMNPLKKRLLIALKANMLGKAARNNKQTFN
jgi:hypothetical protein